MSSHHIVREKQEPALLITAYNQFSDEYLGQLLEWSPMVFVFENELDNISSKGIKIDAVLSGQPVKSDDLQESTKTFVLQPFNLPSALQLLIEQEYPSVNIIGPLDVLPSILPFVDKMDIVLFNEQVKVFPVRHHLTKWYAKGEQFSIISLNHESYNIVGAKVLGAHLFETEQNGLVTFDLSHSTIFVVEKLAANEL